MQGTMSVAVEYLADKLDDAKVEHIVILVTTKESDEAHVASNTDGSLEGAHTVYHVLADAAFEMMDVCPAARVAKLASELPSFQDLLGLRDDEPPVI